jgi:predicted metalloendopeptidase
VIQNGRHLVVVLSVSTALLGTGASAEAPGIDLAGIDRSVAPGDDFFAYANGAWYKATAIPEDRAAFGASAIVYDRTSQRTVELIQDAAKAAAPAGSAPRKVGDYYTSFMDEAGIEAKGLAPVRAKLDKIAAISDVKSLSRYLGTTLRADVDALNATNFTTDNLFGLWIAQDLDQPTRYVPFLLQGGLDMPERTYYVDDSAPMAEARAKFQAHVVKISSSDRSRTPPRGAPASSTSSGRSPRSTRAARTRPTSRSRTTTGRARRSPGRRPASTGRSS